MVRGLLQGHSKAPIPALYMETAQIPLQFIIACRRILFLQTILNRDREELFEAQKHDPSKGDFCKLVEEDIQLLNIQLTEKDIEDMNRYQLKAHTKKKARQAAINYLTDIKVTKSKMNGIQYTDSLDLQSNLQSPLFTREEASLLLALRTRTVRGVRSNSGDMYPDKACPMDGCSEPDSFQHNLVCTALAPAQPSPELHCRVQ